VLGDAAETYEMLGERAKALTYAKQSIAAGTTLPDLAQRPALRSLVKDLSFRTGH
jgi:hypothetical protein